MRRLSSCLIAASLLAVAAPVAAQQAPSQPNAPLQNYRFPVERPSMAGTAWTRGAEYETLLASGSNLPAQPLERVDLANRVSTLIELGRCADARNEAREAGDRQMALKARQMCRTHHAD
jgi:hypothetical protein